MRKRTLSVLIPCAMLLITVCTCYASPDAKIYGCTANSGGSLRIVSGPGLCKNTESGVLLSAYTGANFVIRGHVTSYGGQTDGGTYAGFSSYPISTGVYGIDFNLSTDTLPDCAVTSTTQAQCQVSTKTTNGVTISCAQPTISGTSITYIPVNADFDLVCVD